MNTRMLWYLAIILFLCGVYHGMVWLQDIQKKIDESNEMYIDTLELRLELLEDANKTADTMIKGIR